MLQHQMRRLFYISGSVKSGTNNTVQSGHKYSLWCARENNESIIRLDGTTYTRKINITDQQV